MAERSGSVVGIGAARRREIAVLQRAEHDLLALAPADRAAVALHVDALASDPIPRGALALHGRAEGHIQRRAGRFRLLYRVQGRTILLVAVTGGPV